MYDVICGRVEVLDSDPAKGCKPKPVFGFAAGWLSESYLAEQKLFSVMTLRGAKVLTDKQKRARYFEYRKRNGLNAKDEIKEKSYGFAAGL